MANEGQIKSNAISLQDIVQVFRLKYKWIMLVPLISSAAIGVGVSFLTPVYRAQITFVPTAPPFSAERSGNGVGLSSLTQMIGLPISGGGGATAMSLAVLKSRGLAREFITTYSTPKAILGRDCSGLEKSEGPGSHISKTDPVTYLERAVEKFRNSVLLVAPSATVGVFELSMDWCSADIAAQWAKAYLSLADRKLREQAQRAAQERLEFLSDRLSASAVAETRETLSQLMAREYEKQTFASASEQYAFHVVDSPVAAKIKVSPRTASITLLSFIVIWGIIYFYFLMASRKSSE